MLSKILEELQAAAFDGQDPKWRSASIDNFGSATRWECKKGDLVTRADRGPTWLTKSIYYLGYETITEGCFDGAHWSELIINRDDCDDGYQYTIDGVDIDSTVWASEFTEPDPNDIPF